MVEIDEIEGIEINKVIMLKKGREILTKGVYNMIYRFSFFDGITMFNSIDILVRILAYDYEL